MHLYIHKCEIIYYMHKHATFFLFKIYIEVKITQSCPTLCDPWTIACQFPLSMEFSRPEYWSG